MSIVPQDALIMIDTESLGLKPDSVVLQGAFMAVDLADPDERIAFDSINFPMQPQLDAGRTVSASTLKFWLMDCDEKARKAVLVPSLDGDSDALVAFVRAFIRKIKHVIDECQALGGRYEIWVRRPQHDIPMLNSLFELCGESAPWAYDTINDLATTMNLAKISSSDVDSSDLVKHVALEDCRFQIRGYQAAIKSLRNAGE